MVRFRKMISIVFLCGLAALTLTVFREKDSVVVRAESFIRSGFEDDTMPRLKKQEIKIYIPDNYTGHPCNYTLNLSQDQIKDKISSYEFPGIQKYIDVLFPESSDQTLPNDPIFVTSLSSNHFQEGLAMISNLYKTVRKETRKLIVYDIGLTAQEKGEVVQSCECDVRQFPFDKFPDHVRILKGYAWKPILMQLVAKEHPFAIWLDSAVRFTTNDTDGLVKMARDRGVITFRGKHRIAHQTSIETFRYLNEPPCLYFETKEPEAGLIAVYLTPFVTKYIMMPWVSCALIRECMVTKGNVDVIQNCNGHRHNFHCHRFDQAVLGILMHRLFYKEIERYHIDQGQFAKLCRSEDKRPC